MQRELNSWKEIADHLGVTVRTAQRWEEEEGLPVKRLPGSRSRVSAVVEELDRWRKHEDPGECPVPAAGAEAPIRGSAVTIRGKRLFRWIAAAAVLLAAAAAGLYYVLLIPGDPASWAVEVDTLMVSDASGKEVWRHRFDAPLLHESYRSELPGVPEMVWISDLDGDGDRETLFLELLHESALLYCFSARGEVRWIFDPAIEISAGGKPQVGHFRVMNLLVASLGEGRPKSIVASIIHSPYWPVRIAILDPDGKIERDYWHAGHIGNLAACLAAADLDRDGAMEIYALGMSNARKKAVLVVLDPETMAGASEEEIADYRIDGQPPGREIARVLFGHSCVQESGGYVYNIARAITFTDDGIRVEVEEAPSTGLSGEIYYHLDRDLGLKDIEFGDSYRAIHRRLELEGRIDHPFSLEGEKQRLRDRFRIIR